ncbi:MAG: ClC family H(+)/Cl(-) exchange transporter [Candidatus Nanopelagicales bacterium]
MSFHRGVPGDSSEDGYAVDPWVSQGANLLDAPPADDPGLSGLVRLALLAVLGGAATGLVGGVFRRLLAEADVLRTDLLDWARDDVVARWVVPVVLVAVLVGLARYLVRLVPEAAGSGVQRVEAHIRGEVPAARGVVLPVKFVGGLLSIGSGMVLGREGPTVQMGASIGGFVSRRAKVSMHDTRTLSVALAGAGLGVAFSAPLGGAMFVFEEVAHAFRTRLVVATLAATTTALAVARYVVGAEPVLPVRDVTAGSTWMLLAYVVLGILLGVLGVLYNKVVVALLDVAESLRRIAPEMKAAAVGVFVIAVGLAAPWIIGGGDALNEALLLASPPVLTLLVITVVRWFLGPLSYSVGTPGGLFAPLLVVGAAVGSLVAASTNAVVPALALSATSFAVVGMSTFFAAVVRAPITGVVLIMEMTAQTALVVPMAVAAATAVAVATLLKGPPVYDTLRERMTRPAP